MANGKGTYDIGRHGPAADFATIIFYGSDAATQRKGWRSIGCQSVKLADLDRETAAIERGGRSRETRTLGEMNLAGRA